MMLWFVLVALTGITLIWIGWPLLRPESVPDGRDAYDAAVYLDQLEELEKDLARGLVDASQAEAARTEIERRLLAASRGTDAATAPRVRRHLTMAILLLLAVPLVSLPLYMNQGSPDLPNMPFAERTPVAPEVNGMVAQARARLEEAERRANAAPDDPDVWFDLGRFQLVSRDINGAVEALGRARGLAPDRADIASAYGEAVTRQADGAVTAEARQAFNFALAGNPSDPRSRYFLALAEYQEGREENALRAWSALASTAPPDAPWYPAVEARILETASDLGEDPAKWLPRRNAEVAAGPFAGRGPTGDDIAAAQEMSPEDRHNMIRGMVENLAARLEDKPDDVEGWRQLARSRTVLGDHTAAASAYDRALALQPDDRETLLRGALASAEAEDNETALARFIRLRKLVPPDSEVHRMVSEAIDRLQAVGGTNDTSQ